MARFLIFMVSMLTMSRTGGPASPSFRPQDAYDRFAAEDVRGVQEFPGAGAGRAPRAPGRYGDGWPAQPEIGSGRGGRPGRTGTPGRRRRIRARVTWVAVLLVSGLIFRKVLAWTVLVALSAVLHIVGVNVHLPHVKLAWPWQTISAGTTSNIDLGPWVLQKIEGISRPALGSENFNFTFTHKVSKNIGIWPCWYSSTFDAAGHASATVDLNPGPGWWAPASGHYKLQVLSRPVTGDPGRVGVVMVLPQPQLPQSVHDVTIDDTLSHPIDTQHSWTYPGFGCGGLIRPQFSESILYAQAQGLAFSQVRTNPQITRPLIVAAESEAAQIIRDNFIQPTVNALGYTLTDFTLRWSGRP
ncbi:MAG: hypothetical protein M3Z75_08440 [Actinomycetota bacterium]|nr:hypothetical protein [Actinomycetota bacterium]